MRSGEVDLYGVSHARFKAIKKSLLVFERHKYINSETLGALETLCYEYASTREDALKFFCIDGWRDVVRLSRLIKRIDSELLEVVAGGWHSILEHITKRAGLKLTKAQMAALKLSIVSGYPANLAEDKYRVSRGLIAAITPLISELLSSYKDYMAAVNSERKVNGKPIIDAMKRRIIRRKIKPTLHNLGVEQLSLGFNFGAAT